LGHMEGEKKKRPRDHRGLDGAGKGILNLRLADSSPHSFPDRIGIGIEIETTFFAFASRSGSMCA